MRRLLAPVPLAVIAVVIALVALLAYGLASKSPDASIDEAVANGDREPAPAIDLPNLGGGGRTTLAGYRGKVVVVNFWASWCEPCREESPLLERWHRKISRQGGTVLGVDLLDVSTDARAFARRYRLSYPMVRDRDGNSQHAYGVVGYPESVVVDRKGRIAAVKRGPVDEAWLRKHLPRLLAEPA
jgi:cytochrome c biogenesis protein CcmG, thiol:disulfide interchange protein DsbE